MYQVNIVTVSIGADWRAVYDFVRDPRNFPKWASGLASTINEEQGQWLAGSPMGKVKIRMTSENPYGVLDHHVTLPSGQTVYNPFRAVPNQDGCELSFTVFRTEGVDEAAFARDVAHVAKDLDQLKTLLENQAPTGH